MNPAPPVMRTLFRAMTTPRDDRAHLNGFASVCQRDRSAAPRSRRPRPVLHLRKGAGDPAALHGTPAGQTWRGVRYEIVSVRFRVDLRGVLPSPDQGPAQGGDGRAAHALALQRLCREGDPVSPRVPAPGPPERLRREGQPGLGRERRVALPADPGHRRRRSRGQTRARSSSSSTFTQKNVRQEHHELSTFARKDGKWYFVSGKEVKSKPVVRTEPKVGRNEPCPCGSGKKHKKCCGA